MPEQEKRRIPVTEMPECPHCHAKFRGNEVLYYRNHRYDAYFCPHCRKWLEDGCSGENCSFCSNRPPTAEGLTSEDEDTGNIPKQLRIPGVNMESAKEKDIEEFFKQLSAVTRRTKVIVGGSEPGSYLSVWFPKLVPGEWEWNDDKEEYVRVHMV